MKPTDWKELLKQGLMAGLSVDEFWSLTPYEYSIVIEANAERGFKERTHQAWMIAALIWQKKLPKLEKLLGEHKTYSKQDIEEMELAGKRAEEILRKKSNG